MLLLNKLLIQLLMNFFIYFLVYLSFTYILIYSLIDLLIFAGEVIIKLAPQIVINHTAPDYTGQPLVMETYNFSVKEIFEAVTIDEYIM